MLPEMMLLLHLLPEILLRLLPEDFVPLNNLCH
jgi:hypothetical protein